MKFATGITLMLVAVVACFSGLAAVVVMLPFMTMGALPGWVTGGVIATLASSVVLFWSGALLFHAGKKQ